MQYCLACTTMMDAAGAAIKDSYYLYRGQQRAIGELMMVHLDSAARMPGPRYETMGFAEFRAKLKADGDFASWFERIRTVLPSLPETGSVRLVAVQHGLVDLIDRLDERKLWFTAHRGKLPCAQTAPLSLHR